MIVSDFAFTNPLKSSTDAMNSLTRKSKLQWQLVPTSLTMSLQPLDLLLHLPVQWTCSTEAISLAPASTCDLGGRGKGVCVKRVWKAWFCGSGSAASESDQSTHPAPLRVSWGHFGCHLAGLRLGVCRCSLTQTKRRHDTQQPSPAEEQHVLDVSDEFGKCISLGPSFTGTHNFDIWPQNSITKWSCQLWSLVPILKLWTVSSLALAGLWRFILGGERERQPQLNQQVRHASLGIQMRKGGLWILPVSPHQQVTFHPRHNRCPCAHIHLCTGGLAVDLHGESYHPNLIITYELSSWRISLCYFVMPIPAKLLLNHSYVTMGASEFGDVVSLPKNYWGMSVDPWQNYLGQHQIR